MQLADVLRGTGLVVFITALAGAIAYVGDRVGHQVGRKRLTLFGIRPRYTSTIIAVGTGMLIALVVTLAAIIASQQVKTAFFRLNAINAEIAQLTTRQRDLERKVNTGRIVVNAGQVIGPQALIIFANQTPAQRLRAVKQFYADTVQFVNRLYVPQGLRKFVPPPDVDKTLDDATNSLNVQSMFASSNVMLIAVSDSNLYRRDPIHFTLDFVPDREVFAARQPIAQLQVPAGKNVNINLAAQELYSHVASIAAEHQMPSYFLQVRATQTFPGPDEMQRMLNQGRGTYLMTAFAATDVYPHLIGIPVVITLEKAAP